MKMKNLILAAATAVACVPAFAVVDIAWLDTLHDFGPFREDEGLRSCEFRFVNIGDEPLVIVSARASCGCTTPQFPREAIAPGDTSAVTVTYDPTGRPGHFSKRVTIETNAATRTSKLLIEGTVIGSEATIANRYPYDMGALKAANSTVMFGNVKKGRLKTLFLNAYNRSAENVTPKIVYKPEYVDVAFSPDTVPPGERLSLICYLRSNKCPEFGLNTDSVIVTTDGVTHFPVFFTVNVEEDFSHLDEKSLVKAPVATLSADKVDFGRIARGGGVLDGSVRLVNEGRDRLDVRRVYCTEPAVTVAIDKNSLKRGKTAEISVAVDTSKIDGDFLDVQVVIITNDPAHPSQTVRLVGEFAGN